MEAKELMIGDWVRLNDSYYQIEDVSNNGWVHLLYNNARVHLPTDYIVEYLRPIPLTPEIFKKNGFFEEIVTNADSNDDYTSYHWNPTPQYPSDGLWFYPTFSGYAFDSRISEIRIKYVHELQHLLRLCGIDKEITLT